RTRLDAPRPYDIPDERRGAEVEAHPVRAAPAGRRHLLRRPGTKVAAVSGRPHGDLHGQRMVHPFLWLRCRGCATRRLVFTRVRVGPATAFRGGIDALKGLTI